MKQKTCPIYKKKAENVHHAKTLNKKTRFRQWLPIMDLMQTLDAGRAHKGLAQSCNKKANWPALEMDKGWKEACTEEGKPTEASQE